METFLRRPAEGLDWVQSELFRANQLHDPSPLATVERNLPREEPPRRGRRRFGPYPHQDSPRRVHSLAEFFEEVGGELQRPNGDENRRLRKTGGQGSCDSNIAASERQSCATRRREKEARLLLARLKKDHLEIAPSRRDRKPRKAGAGSEIDRGTRHVRNQGESGQRFAVVTGKDLGGRTGTDQRQLSIPAAKLFVMSVERENRRLRQGFRRERIDLKGEVGKRNGGEVERHG